MNEHALTLFRGHLDEIKDVLGRLVVLIEEDLALNVLPEESEVDDAESLPLILDLFARAVDDSGNFVHLNEVEILRRELIANE